MQKMVSLLLVDPDVAVLKVIDTRDITRTIGLVGRKVIYPHHLRHNHHGDMVFVLWKERNAAGIPTIREDV